MTNQLDEYYFYNGELVNDASIASESIPANAVYEVMKIIDGKPLFFEDHMERFHKSINKQGHIFDIPAGEILNEIAFLCQANKQINKNIKMIYIPLDEVDAFDFMMYFSPRITISQTQRDSGVKVKTMLLERHNPGIKTIGESYKDSISEIYHNKDLLELLLVNGDGIITEGSRSNVFFVKDNTVYTSPAEAILLGITRKKIIHLCQDKGVPIVYKKISVKEAYGMEGAFLTGTSIGVVPIRYIDDKEYNHQDDIIQRLAKGYHDSVQDDIINFVLPE
ncbi:MAG: aminotransferase class IV [Eubacteriales bacterium]